MEGQRILNVAPTETAPFLVTPSACLSPELPRFLAVSPRAGCRRVSTQEGVFTMRCNWPNQRNPVTRLPRRFPRHASQFLAVFYFALFASDSSS